MQKLVGPLSWFIILFFSDLQGALKSMLLFFVVFLATAENFDAKFKYLLPIYIHTKVSKGILIPLTKTKLLDFFLQPHHLFLRSHAERKGHRVCTAEKHIVIPTSE